MSKSFTYFLTEKAKEDLISIKDYICNYLFNPEASIELGKKLYKGFSRIEEHPYSCPKYFDSIYRKLIIDNYIALYSIDEENKFIIISRVIYGGRNLFEFI